MQVSEWMLCGHIGKGVFTHLTDKDLPSPGSPGCRIIPAAPGRAGDPPV